METKDIIELFYLVISCTNNMNKKYNHRFDKQVENACLSFCNKHNINITHGSAYKELRHKTYYYRNKNIKSIINNGIDLYKLRKNKLISDTEIVDLLLK